MRLLDTDVLVDLLRGFPPAVAWLQSVADEQVGVPGFVAMELIQGCRNKQEQRVVETELRKLEILWPEAASCDRALATFARFYLSDGIGLLDALIAEIAKEQGVPLHTFNEKHYRPIPGVETVQPYRRV